MFRQCLSAFSPRSMIANGKCRWKDSTEQRIQRVEQMLLHLANGSSLEDFVHTEPQIQSPETADNRFDRQGQNKSTFGQVQNQPQQSVEVVMDSARGPGAIPASCVFEVSKASPVERHDPTISRRSDIVSQGIISLANAEKYFGLYHQHLDHFVYNILAAQDTLASIRVRSPLLTAVICAVSALHSASPDYEICYQAFRDELILRMFIKDHTFDDVRAMCIGAFWLSDMSWSLVGAGTSSPSSPSFCLSDGVRLQLYASLPRSIYTDASPRFLIPRMSAISALASISWYMFG